MDPLNIDVFQVAAQRLAWADGRQQVLARNVANLSTPGYQAQDVAPFAASLAASQSAAAVLAQTSPLHLAGAGHGAQVRQTRMGGRSPDGNSVSVERELGAVADTSGIQELALNLHHTYETLFKIAFGRAG